MEVQQFISIAPWTIIFQILNLLLLMVLFKKYLFKPVTEILEKRQAEIEGHYQEAQQAETDAKAMKADYESKMAGARQEADRVIKTATESANAMSASLLRGHNAEQMVNSAGIVLSQAAGIHQVVKDSAFTKRMQPAFAASDARI